MSPQANSDLRTRAWSAILSYAIFRWESALTIALTILLIYFVPQPLPGFQWWFWLILGGIGEALIIYTSIGDVDTGARVVSDLFRQEFNPDLIKLPKYRTALERALSYRSRIEESIRKSEAGILQQHLQESTAGISDWIAQIFRLAQRLDAYERDDMIRQDIASAPLMLRDLETRLQREPDPAVREQVRLALASKQEQWQNLQKLTQTMAQAELQLEATLTALGTVYSQLVLIHSKDDIQDSRAQRLRDNIADQIAQLSSLQEAMDDVYARKQ
jgi:hypothetical protein